MRVLLAGGVYRHSAERIAAQQPTPEIVLTAALRERGVEVENAPLEHLGRIAFSRRFDVVHVHHLSRAAVAASLSPVRTPLVFTAHSSLYPVARSHRAGLRVIARLMAAGVCLSEVEADAFAEWFPQAAPRLRVIPNGIDFAGFPVARRALDGSGLRALFVGQLIELKNVHLLVQALRDFPDMRLRLVYHNDELEVSLRTLAASAGVADRVTFVGRRSGDELVAEYLDAHVLLLPSAHEALPTVVTEALATGLPVVASAVGGVPAQVEDAGIVFPAHDEQARRDGLTAGLAGLVSRFDHVAGRAVDRANAVRERYSVDEMVKWHIDLYHDVSRRAHR